MRTTHLLVPFLLASFFSVMGQNRFEEDLNQYLTEQKQEKVYLHLDKPNYGAGDIIWFKAYVVDGTFHTPSEISKTLYVELVNAKTEIMDTLVLLVENGISKGNISLSKNIAPGNYRVRAYTNWMRNFDSDFFFRKDFKILNSRYDEPTEQKSATPSSNLYIDLLPEGGDLIDKIPTKVAIKTTDNLGRGIPSNGVIINQNGDEVSSFKSNEFGNALAFFVPNSNEEYFALVNSIKQKLPLVKEKGATMRANHSFQSGQISIAVLSSQVDLTNGTLVAHQRGKLLFTQECQDSKSFSLRVSKAQLKPGIVHFTFFDKEGIPLTERLVFPNIPTSKSGLEIVRKEDSYKKRSKVDLYIQDNSDSIHSASLTINPREEANYHPHGENIVNHLLLTSDLKGYIESPDYYFQRTKDAYDALDLLMLTQGWSRFDWEALKNESFSPQYHPENGITIRGRITDFYSPEKAKQGEISLLAPEMGMAEVSGKTDENGTFIISGNQFYDSTRVILKAHSFRGKKNKKDEDVTVSLIHSQPPKIKSTFVSPLQISESFVKKVDKLNQISRAFNLDPEATLLDELVVTGQRLSTERLLERTVRYREPDDRIILDSLNATVAGRSVFDLLRMVSGVTVSGTSPNQSVSIRGVSTLNGQSGPLFVLDGIPVDNSTIQNMPVQTVEFIDVLKGPKTAIYGVRGAGGVILIYTREGGTSYKQEKAKGLLVFTHPGYFKAKQFYSPQYDVPQEAHAIPDYRSTLFWEPEVVFEDGKAKIEFYTSDQVGLFDVRIEGIKKNGDPFFEKTSIIVQ